jgi:hypothetical protein
MRWWWGPLCTRPTCLLWFFFIVLAHWNSQLTCSHHDIHVAENCWIGIKQQSLKPGEWCRLQGASGSWMTVCLINNKICVLYTAIFFFACMLVCNLRSILTWKLHIVSALFAIYVSFYHVLQYILHVILLPFVYGLHYFFLIQTINMSQNHLNLHVS